MDLDDEIRRARPSGPDPEPEVVERHRQELASATREASPHLTPRARGRGIGARLSPGRITATAGVAILAMTAVGIVLLGGNGERAAKPHEDGGPWHAGFATEMQRYSTFEYTPLTGFGTTLPEVAADGLESGGQRYVPDLVGAGEVTDLRLGYQAVQSNPGDGTEDVLQHMYLAVEPTGVLAGREPDSGEVLVDLLAPPIDRETGSRGVEELREDVIGGEVLFMLTAETVGASLASDEELRDEDVGRPSTSEPVYRPLVPTLLLGRDPESKLVAPLLTDEVIEDDRANIEFAERAFGSEVAGFTSATR